MLSRVQLFETPWTVAFQVPLSVEFSRQEDWSGLPFPTTVDFSNPGIKPTSPVSPVENDSSKRLHNFIHAHIWIHKYET